jgi:hypothetical protein
MRFFLARASPALGNAVSAPQVRDNIAGTEPKGSRLFYRDFEERVGMLVTPAPVCLLILVFEFIEIAVFTMVLFGVHTIRLIFVAVPLMIVIVLFVVVCASVISLGSQRKWCYCKWDSDKSGT